MAAGTPITMLVLVLLSAGAPGARAAVAGTEVTPIQKVISMLQEMIAKGKKEKHMEQVEFAKFQTWCTETRAQLEKQIEEGKEEITMLTACIEKSASDAEQLAIEIEGLTAQIAEWEAEAKNATEVREKENKDYEAAHLDLSESIDAIKRAIAVLKSREADVPQSLAQLKSSAHIPERAKLLVESFLMVGSDSSDESGAPEANAYEFQSQSVIDMLEKLLKKFRDELLTLEKEEIKAKTNYDLLMQQLTDDIGRSKEILSRKVAAKAAALEKKAQCTQDLQIAEAALADDEKALSDTNAECTAGSEEFESNQVVRAAEIEALEKATEILASGKVSGNAEKHLDRETGDAALAAAGGASLAQLRSAAGDDPSTRQRVAAFLEARARKLGSRYLALVADRAAGDPFKKVKKMIKDLIVKLMEEANEEADKKAFCDAELATNKQTRDIKTAEVEELQAGVEKATAEITELATAIAELSDEISALRAAQAKATTIREDEKAKNAVIIADAKEGQTAVQQAIEVLQEFYGSMDAALLQGQTDLKGQMRAAEQVPYKGMQAESGGVFGMLEVILSDFARLETQTSVAEDTAQAAYEKFMAETDEDIAVKETEMKHKESKKALIEEKLRELKKSLELTQAELDAALAYYEKLKPDCVDLGLSYEERVRQREEEIESLQEALKILAGEELA